MTDDAKTADPTADGAPELTLEGELEEELAEQDASDDSGGIEHETVTLLGSELLVDGEGVRIDGSALAAWLAELAQELAPEGDSLVARFVDDEAMREISNAYRQIDASTDVLSFPGEKTPEGLHLGDVVISVPYALRQAAERGHGLEREAQVLLLHGLLHCLGYDHETDDGQMERLETELRARWIRALDVPDDGSGVPGSRPTAFDGERRAARVVLIGRPNAGKSTLMNRFLGEKLAIVSDKPQTTRQRLLGIYSTERGQLVFLDTPGVHKPEYRLNRRMVKAATDALAEADVVVLVVDASVKWGKGDDFMLELIRRVDRPKIVALNKIDCIRKSRLLPLIERLSGEEGFEEILPISALEGDNADQLLEMLWQRAPTGVPLYDEELLTTQTERFLVAERIREKILLQTRDELPFATAVTVDAWREDEEEDRLIIQASILVEKPGQKKIIIGQKGSRIKEIGRAARLDLQEFLGRRIFLDLFVRQVANWRDDPRRLAELDRQNAFN